MSMSLSFVLLHGFVWLCAQGQGVWEPDPFINKYYWSVSVCQQQNNNLGCFFSPNLHILDLLSICFYSVSSFFPTEHYFCCALILISLYVLQLTITQTLYNISSKDTPSVLFKCINTICRILKADKQVKGQPVQPELFLLTVYLVLTATATTTTDLIHSCSLCYSFCYFTSHNIQYAFRRQMRWKQMLGIMSPYL